MEEEGTKDSLTSSTPMPKLSFTSDGFAVNKIFLKANEEDKYIHFNFP